jgi:hypothetical protein
LIDRGLVDAGWTIVPQKDFYAAKSLKEYDRCAIEEFPNPLPSTATLCLSRNRHLSQITGLGLSVLITQVARRRSSSQISE